MKSVVLLKGIEPEDLGLIPSFLDDDDPRPAKEQFNERYAHGGGWRSMKGFDNKSDDGLMVLQYPGDADLYPIAFWAFRDELVVVYPYGMVAIFQPGGEYEVSRMD